MNAVSSTLSSDAYRTSRYGPRSTTCAGVSGEKTAESGRAAFARIAETVRPSGQLAVYVYARYGGGHYGPDLIRAVSTRLPAPIMLALSTAAIPLYYVYRIPVLGKLLHLFAPISMLPDWRWRWLDTFDWYTPRYQSKHLYPEVFRWFRDNGFHDVAIFDEPIRMRGVKAAPEAVTQDPVNGRTSLPRLVAAHHA